MHDRNLVIFLVMAIFIGLVCVVATYFTISSNDTGLLIAFTIGVGVTALIYPNLMEPLDPKAVDFWYYFLAMVAVILFFFHDSSQRQMLRSYYDYQQLLNKEAKIDRQLLALRAIASKSDWARFAIAEQARRQAEAEARIVEFFCREGTPGSLPGTPIHRFDPDAKLSIQFYNCDKFRELNREENWRKLAEKLETNKLEEIDVLKIPNKNVEVMVGNTSVSMGFALQQILEASTAQGSSKLKETEVKLDANLRETRLEIEELTSKHTAPLSFDESKPGLADLTVILVWPYVLVLMSGLKLAKIKYIPLSKF